MTTHQLVITTVSGLVLHTRAMPEFDAQLLQDTLEQRLRGAQPVLGIVLDGDDRPIRFNTRHALHWRVTEYKPRPRNVLSFDLPESIGGPL